jgi:hypothetical protein
VLFGRRPSRKYCADVDGTDKSDSEPMSGVGEGLVIMDTMERMQIWKRETSTRRAGTDMSGLHMVS